MPWDWVSAIWTGKWHLVWKGTVLLFEKVAILSHYSGQSPTAWPVPKFISVLGRDLNGPPWSWLRAMTYFPHPTPFTSSTLSRSWPVQAFLDCSFSLHCPKSVSENLKTQCVNHCAESPPFPFTPSHRIFQIQLFPFEFVCRYPPPPSSNFWINAAEMYHPLLYTRLIIMLKDLIECSAGFSS